MKRNLTIALICLFTIIGVTTLYIVSKNPEMHKRVILQKVIFVKKESAGE